MLDDFEYETCPECGGDLWKIYNDALYRVFQECNNCGKIMEI